MFNMSSDKVLREIITAATGGKFADYVVPQLSYEAKTALLENISEVIISSTIMGLAPGDDDTAIGFMIDEMSRRYGRGFAEDLRKEIADTQEVVAEAYPVYRH